MKDRTPDEKKAVKTGVLGALPSLVGLAGGIASAIPGLKKPKRTNTEQRAANRASGRVQSGAVGGSQTGFGATRGLNLRTGLRQASQVATDTAGISANAAARDENRFILEETARNKRLAQFGMDTADMAASFGQSVVDAKAAKEVEIAEKAAQLEQLPDAPQYDLGGGPIVDPYTQTIQELPTQEMGGPDLANQATLPTEEMGGAARPPPPSIDPLDAFLGLPDKETIYRAAPELALQHSLENLALQEAERQGIPLARVYARIQRMQNLPAIKAAQTRLELESEYQDF